MTKSQNNISLFPINTSSIFRNYKILYRKYHSKKNKKIKIAILSVSSTQHLSKLIILFLSYFGINVTIYESKFGQYYEEAVFNNKKLHKFNPDFIWVNISNRILGDVNDFSNKNINIGQINKKIKQIVYNILNNYRAELILNNLDYTNNLNATIDNRGSNGILDKINKINNSIYSLVTNNEKVTLFDINSISSNIGLNKWNSIQDWTQYKYHPSLNSSAIFCFEFSSLIKSYLGFDKKCIVLDLDNTLWEGIIGDIGYKRINFDKNDIIGYSYYRFQSFIKNLRQKGIILTIVSKNNHQNAIKAFNNKNFQLKNEDFSIILCNWENKDKNIKKIARSLNILTESMVFIDDNPFERNLVKKNIPNISVPDLPEDHSEWISYIQKYNYFYNIKSTTEDKNRIKTLDISKKINILFKDQKDNYNEYLKSLKMKTKIFIPKSENYDRIIQLVNKTNQFNTANSLINISDIINLKKEKNNFIYIVSLKDNIAEYGIISILWGAKKNQNLVIDNWVMSCRVFNRYLEEYIMNYLFSKTNEIRINYIKTQKNIILLDIMKNLGCSLKNSKFTIDKKRFKSKNYKIYSSSK